MAWFTRFTRFGDVHLVYGQEKNMSCGIASLMMCVFKINKLTPGATAVTVEEQVYAKYSAAYGTPYTDADADTTGTDPTAIAAVLSGYTGETWAWDTQPPEAVPQLLLDKVGVSHLGPVVGVKPVILGLDWDKGGAHYVVVDTVKEVLGTYYATVCDPWDANVHVVEFAVGSPFRYHAGDGGLHIDFGRKTEGDVTPYTKDSDGTVKEWGVICPK